MQTRKYPRTLNEAFGPHTSQHIDESDPMDWQDATVIAGGVIALLVVIGMAVAGAL